MSFSLANPFVLLISSDWLWPAIWMMPKDFVYGEWPRSGEIEWVTV